MARASRAYPARGVQAEPILSDLMQMHANTSRESMDLTEGVGDHRHHPLHGLVSTCLRSRPVAGSLGMDYMYVYVDCSVVQTTIHC